MTSSHLNTFGCMLINARTAVMAPVVFAFLLVAGLLFSRPPAAAQASPPPEVKKVTNDLYFFFDFGGSNSIFLVTEEAYW